MTHRRVLGPSPSVALLLGFYDAYGRGLQEGIASYLKNAPKWKIHFSEARLDRRLLPAWLEHCRPAGIIARVEDSSIARILQSPRVPVVDVGAAGMMNEVPQVAIDDQAIARIAIDHFVEIGFRNFAYCGWKGYRWSESRQQAFEHLLSGQGTPLLTLMLPDYHDRPRSYLRDQDAYAAGLVLFQSLLRY